ncbi:MAG: helix-turn-helix domain-containing protein [Gemmatimonadaceae bacterium]
MGETSALIDPTRALLVRVESPCEIVAAAPAVQEFGVLAFTSRMLIEHGAAGQRLLRGVEAMGPGPIPIRWSPRLMLGLQLVARAHREREPDTMNAGSAPGADLVSLLQEALTNLDAPRSARPGRRESRARAAHRKLTRSAKLLLASAPEQPHLLADIARAVSASPFHLEHVFQEEAGVPLHRFLLELRLALALGRLVERDLPLSNLALDLGFATHSHFTAAFRRAIGQTPSAVRGALLANSALFEASTPPLLAPTERSGVWIRILRTHAAAVPITIEWPSRLT